MVQGLLNTVDSK